MYTIKHAICYQDNKNNSSNNDVFINTNCININVHLSVCICMYIYTHINITYCTIIKLSLSTSVFIISPYTIMFSKTATNCRSCLHSLGFLYHPYVHGILKDFSRSLTLHFQCTMIMIHLYT